MYREHLAAVSAWFECLSECEQIVALYSLLKRLAPAQARFLTLAMDQSLENCPELQVAEQQANNPGFVSSLLTESAEIAMSQLLQHLPLLRPGNNEARSRYIAVIPRVLSHATETGSHLEEARQLLSYSLIHPALTNDDKRTLNPWLKMMEERITNGGMGANTPITADSSPTQQQPPQQQGQQTTQQHNQQNRPGMTVSSNGHTHLQFQPNSQNQGGVGNYTNGSQPRVRRSNSLTPPVSIAHSVELWSSQDDLSGRQKARSFSLSSESGPPLSPQSSQASSGSGSESHLDDLRLQFSSDSCGMRDIPSWLKSLRLHKYAWLFAQLSYEEMLNLTEEKLATLGVTKGARHKIVLSVRKLRERYHTLCQLERDVVAGASLSQAMDDLRAVLCSPIKAVDEKDKDTTVEDIPEQFTKVMGKVCTQLLVSGRAEEKLLSDFVWLLDRCLQHEAFSAVHKQRLGCWKMQLQHVWRPSPQRHLHNRYKWHNPHSQTFTVGSHPVSNTRFQSIIGQGCQSPQTQMQQQSNQHQQQTAQQRAATFASLFQSLAPSQQQHRNSLAVIGSPQLGGISEFMAKRPSLQDPLLMEPLEGHSQLTRTRSAPHKPSQQLVSPDTTLPPTSLPSTLPPTNTDYDPINSRLESLCLSMTEHALGTSLEL
ncbi:Protein Smaug-like protein 1 [Frankliniella fusca]|uniref:Protein Smaug n=1 Tax=Frankliniella fusca TaxID=407009 RepID=A0AAE1L6B7_9NEOP|nr:Protein Smaug-like protein 1 [Frankliniella fusca]